MGETIDKAVEYFTSKIERVKDNPELITPYALGSIGAIIAIVQTILRELNSTSIFASFFLIAIALIIYQILNCNIRVEEILSDIEHIKKLKSMLVAGKINEMEFEKRVALLKKYPNKSTMPDLKTNHSQ
ncbi:MAG: hypothetical protein ACYDDV_11995 [Methanoregula sp.]